MRPHLNLLTSLMLWSVSIFSQPNEVLKEAQLFFGKYPFKVHSIDRIALNEQIKERDSLKLMKILSLYFPLEIGWEGKEQIEIRQKIMENGNIGIFYSHHNIPDDALKAHQVMMELKSNGYLCWEVISIRSNWQCRRSNEQISKWGIAPCP